MIEPAPAGEGPGIAVPDAADAVASGGHRRALYRTWRAQRFADLIGQDATVTTLRHAVETDRCAHAYLFVGPRGTGKTSTARLLAKAINCLNRGPDGEPCDECGACVSIREGRAMDVIEIDAASHGLVEDARDLVMRALTAPTELRRRIYIIDEVHMLSTHAFNALLKLIEEPPDHVVFILATTDTHKVPSTIISRTQRFDFRRLPVELIASKLERICRAEGAAAEPDALLLLGQLADGAMRDAESLLDQVLSYAGGNVTVGAVRDALGLADQEAVAALLDALLAGDAATALDLIERLADAGREMGQLASQAGEEARRRLLRSAVNPRLAGDLATLLRALSEAAGAGAREGRARLLLELLSVERSLDAPSAGVPAPAAGPASPDRAPSAARATSAAAEAPTAAGPTPAPNAAPAPAPATTPQPPPGPRAAAASIPPAEEEGARSPASAAGSRPTEGGDQSPPTLDVVRGRWAEVIEQATPVVKPLLRESRPISVAAGRLTLAFPEGREFMRSRITARADSIEQLLAALFGGRWTLECVAASVELEPLSVRDAVGVDAGDPDSRALLDSVLRITGGELVDVREVS